MSIQIRIFMEPIKEMEPCTEEGKSRIPRNLQLAT